MRQMSVISQAPITANDVVAADKHAIAATQKVDFLKSKLAESLLDLGRRSDELRSEMVRRGLTSL